MKLSDFIAVMERIAPPELAFEYDNPGLLVDTRRDIKKVLVALDCTVQAANEAAETGCDLLLTHHPIFFNPVKKLLFSDPGSAAAMRLIEAGVGLFAAHTNLDAALGGVNDCLAATLGLADVAALQPEGLGRLGRLPQPVPLHQFAREAAGLLEASVRVCDGGKPACTIALIGGSGGSDVEAAAAAGADTLLTGEIKHSQALHARHLGLNVVEAGHYETERIVLLPLIKRLQQETNDVQYTLTRFDAPCLRGI